jgi:hypothetical protein
MVKNTSGMNIPRLTPKLVKKNGKKSSINILLKKPNIIKEIIVIHLVIL